MFLLRRNQTKKFLHANTLQFRRLRCTCSIFYVTLLLKNKVTNSQLSSMKRLQFKDTIKSTFPLYYYQQIVVSSHT